MAQQHVIPEVVKLRAIAFGLSAAAVLTAISGFLGGNTLLLAMLIAAPVIVLAINQLPMCIIILIGSFHSWLYVPGFPVSMSIFYILSAGISPVLLLKRAIMPVRYPSHRSLKYLAAGYLVVVVVTMCVRGFGIRALGSDLWGGANYMNLCIALIFFLLADAVSLNFKQWRLTVALFFLAVLLPAVAEQVYVRSGGVITLLYHFIKPEGVSATASLYSYQTGSGILRFSISKSVSYLFILSVALFPFRGRYRILIGLSLGIAAVFAGLSGHRSTVLYLILLVPTCILLKMKGRGLRFLVLYACAMLCMILFLWAFGTKLPLPYQRALSWVPFATFDWQASDAASSSTQWRIELWKMLIPLMSDHWLIGRGFAFDPSALFLAEFSGWMRDELQIVTHDYHSGPISMLLDLGAFGFVFGSGLLLHGIYIHIRYRRTAWSNEHLSRLHVAVLATYCVDVFRFFFVYGHASQSIVALAVHLVILNGLYQAEREIRDQAPGVPADKPPEGHLAQSWV